MSHSVGLGCATEAFWFHSYLAKVKKRGRLDLFDGPFAQTTHSSCLSFQSGRVGQSTSVGPRSLLNASVGPFGMRGIKDHTAFMVLVLQPYDVYRELILGFASQEVLADERIALVSPIIVSACFSALPGFAPAGEALLFRQKDPKPLTPRLASWERTDDNLKEGRPTRFAQTRPADC